MSALAQYEEIYFAPARKTELQAMRDISALTSRSPNIDEGLAAIAASVLHIKGLGKIEIEPASGVVLFGPTEWGNQGGRLARGIAIAEIETSGRNWGRMKIHFDLASHGFENPLSFARFTARQIANWLHQSELRNRRDLLRQRVGRLKERLATRKRVQRAMGILVQTRNISEAEAFLLLVKYGRESRRNLFQVSEAIIVSQQDTWFRPPVLRRLRSNEATGVSLIR